MVLGGVLFALEEGCSFWNQSLTWKALFCSMCAFFGLNMLSGLAISNQKQDDLSNNHVITLIGEGLVSFGTFPQNKNLWTAKDLIVFILMGFGGGILGATFNALNKKLTIYRFKFMHRFVLFPRSKQQLRPVVRMDLKLNPYPFHKKSIIHLDLKSIKNP